MNKFIIGCYKGTLFLQILYNAEGRGNEILKYFHVHNLIIDGGDPHPTVIPLTPIERTTLGGADDDVIRAGYRLTPEILKAIHQLFPWLGHLFADSVYNGAKLRDALVKFVTGPSRSSNAPLMRPAFNCCRAAGWSNAPWPGSIETDVWQRMSRHRLPAPKRGSMSPRYSFLIRRLVQSLHNISVI